MAADWLAGDSLRPTVHTVAGPVAIWLQSLAVHSRSHSRGTPDGITGLEFSWRVPRPSSFTSGWPARVFLRPLIPRLPLRTLQKPSDSEDDCRRSGARGGGPEGEYRSCEVGNGSLCRPVCVGRLDRQVFAVSAVADGESTSVPFACCCCRPVGDAMKLL